MWGFILPPLEIAVVIHAASKGVCILFAKGLDIFEDKRGQDRLSGTGDSMEPQEASGAFLPVFVLWRPGQPSASMRLVQVSCSAVVGRGVSGY